MGSRRAWGDSDRTPGDDHPHEGLPHAGVPTVALGFERDRNRALLAELLSGYAVVEVTESVPEDVDLCIVDTGGLSGFRDALVAWKEREHPTAAPVLLLASDDATTVWERFGESVGDLLDGIQPIPFPRQGIRARVERLLETRRRSLVARRRERELALYKRAMDDADLGITIADASKPDMPLTYANNRFLSLTGYDRDEVIGRNPRYLQGPETEESTVETVRAAIAAEEPVSVEIRNYRKDGEPFWNAMRIVPVRNDCGTVTHFLGFQQDVTERRQRVASLEQNVQIVQSLDDPVFFLDGDGRVIETNVAAESAFGLESDNGGEPLSALLGDTESIETAIEAVRDSSDSETVEFTTTDDGGDRIVYQFQFQQVSVSEPAGEPVHRIVVVGRDISLLREYQDRLSVLDRVLRHNIRNKLNVAKGQAKLLRNERTDLSAEEIDQFATSIDTAVTTILELAEEARKFNQSIDPTKFEQVTAEVGSLTREVCTEVDRSNPDVDLQVDVPDEIEAVCPTTIRLCIEHLVENAVEYNDSETPTVSVVVEETTAPQAVTIRVVDDGTGFPEVERQALSSGAERPMEHVQGVGLWLIRWAVSNVGGSLEVQNRPSGGAEVSLHLQPAASGTATDG